MNWEDGYTYEQYERDQEEYERRERKRQLEEEREDDYYV